MLIYMSDCHFVVVCQQIVLQVLEFLSVKHTKLNPPDGLNRKKLFKYHVNS